MKIELKLSADQIKYLESKCFLIEAMDFRRLNEEAKRNYTIMIDVLDKVVSKAKSISRKVSLFHQSKNHKITFKYHEASILWAYLQGFHPTETDAYKSNLALIIINQLDKELKQ